MKKVVHRNTRKFNFPTLLGLVVCLWLGLPAQGQVFESGSNNTVGTGESGFTFPNALSGQIQGADVDFWTIPDGTSGTYELLDLFNVNIFFATLDVELYEYTDAARTLGLVVTALNEADQFVLDPTKYYSLRVSGNASAPTTLIPPTISTVIAFQDLVDDFNTQLGQFQSNFGGSLSGAENDIIDFLQILMTAVSIGIDVGVALFGWDTISPSFISDINSIIASNPFSLNPTDYYTLTFILTSPGAGGGVAAPVVWADFSAALKEGDVALAWSTAAEENNAGFEVQRSSDATTWEVLDFVSGKGTTESLSEYTFSDHAPQPGYNYYRLKQIDFNGDFEYSAIREVVLAPNYLSSSFEAYPNPVQDVLNVSPFVGQVSVLDISGKLLQQHLANGVWQHLSFESLPAGVYILHLEPVEGEKEIIKILKN